LFGAIHLATNVLLMFFYEVMFAYKEEEDCMDFVSPIFDRAVECSITYMTLWREISK
jgi:hypothetical protein